MLGGDDAQLGIAGDDNVLHTVRGHQIDGRLYRLPGIQAENVRSGNAGDGFKQHWIPEGEMQHPQSGARIGEMRRR